VGSSSDNEPHLPPRLALRFLEWFCPRKLYEGVEGDLLEQFTVDYKKRGAGVARLLFVRNVLRFFRPGIILRNKFSNRIIHLTMFRNYLTVAVRNVLKNKVFSAINIFGLGIGLAACMLIFQFVSFELSYDKFNSKLDRTYRVTNDRFQHGKLVQHGTIMYPTIGPSMAKDFPEIETYTRLMPAGDMMIKIDDKVFRGDDCHFADEHFLSVFDFKLLAGDRITALKDRYAMVITEKLAKKYFDANAGDYEKILGKLLIWGLDSNPYKVTGIVADPPANSHIQFDALCSYNTLISADNRDADNSWTWSDMRHYLVLKPGTDYRSLEAKFPAFSERYFQGDKVSGSVEKFYLQPMKDAHLYSNYEYDIAKTANGKAVWSMLVVAVFILVIAWINYINLTTSRALDRAKEVGLRKVMGAMKTQLVKQFIFESALVSLLALIVAILIVQLAQAGFNDIIDGNLSWWTVLSNLEASTIVLAGVTLLGGVVLSGFYPAFVLSSYQPVTVLKGKFQRSSSGQLLRKTLVIFQFMASAALITGTVIVSRQLEFMNEADLGINIHDTIVISSPELTPWDSTFIQRVENFKQELLQIKGVVQASTNDRLPGERLPRAFGVRSADQPSEANYTLSVQNIDYGYFDTYEAHFLAGRKLVATDHRVKFGDINTVVLNLSAVKLLGMETPEKAIGKEIIWGNNRTRRWTVVGVINDFHQESLKNPMEPMVFRPVYNTYASTSVKVRDIKYGDVLGPMEALFKKFFPSNSFQYTILEDSYKNQYRDDNRFGRVISIFTLLGIMISCLGLIALSSYTAVQRTKEIGIRKVLGASLASIVSLLSADFIRLVLIAAVMSLPIAYFAMSNWLTSYAYRIELSLMLFVVPVLIILLIAAATISFQVLRAAMTNPAETLKYE
jgi:putative ABC transport system permease protein